MIIVFYIFLPKGFDSEARNAYKYNLGILLIRHSGIKSEKGK